MNYQVLLIPVVLLVLAGAAILVAKAYQHLEKRGLMTPGRSLLFALAVFAVGILLSVLATLAVMK